jgi:hypothetical protein
VSCHLEEVLLVLALIHANIFTSSSQLVEYISAAAATGGIEGRFNPDEAMVKMDGELGMLWTPWESFKDEKMTHKG